MPRKFFRKYLPSHDSVRGNRLIARFGRFLHHPNLWHLNRRSVSGGVAVGLFSGLVPGPLQMLTALILALVGRVNLPVALLLTLFTNPFTIVPLYIAAYFLGTLITGERGEFTPPPEIDWGNFGTWLSAAMDWFLGLGVPLVVGLLTLAVMLALAGYVVVQIAWRISVGLAWKRRQRRRAQRAA